MLGTWRTADEAIAMPPEDLAVQMLQRLHSGNWQGRGEWPNRSGQMSAWVVESVTSQGAGVGRSQTEILAANHAHIESLAEAWGWLCAEGLLARAVIPGNPNHDAYSATRRGVELLDAPDPLAFIRGGAEDSSVWSLAVAPPSTLELAPPRVG